MHASGIFTAGLIVGGSFGIIATLIFITIQHLIHNSRYRDMSAQAEHLRMVASTATAVHRGHHEKRAAA